MKKETKIIVLIVTIVIAVIVLASATIIAVTGIMSFSFGYSMDKWKDVLETIPPAYNPENKETSNFSTPSITYTCNATQGTITIYSVEGNSSELIWSNVVFSDVNWEFQATLPTGTIDKGDVITNCKGRVSLTWKLTGALIFTARFN